VIEEILEGRRDNEFFAILTTPGAINAEIRTFYALAEIDMVLSSIRVNFIVALLEVAIPFSVKAVIVMMYTPASDSSLPLTLIYLLATSAVATFEREL